MTTLQGKNILLGVTGGIAAYKSAEIVRGFKKAGAQVQVVMTRNARRFITPLTLETLSQNRVMTEMFPSSYEDEEEAGTLLRSTSTNLQEIDHIALAQRADVVLIAPATANIIGKLAHGICDDLLSTLVIATKAPVILAPAMNCYMYEHPVVQGNLEKLKSLGVQVIEPEAGFLACQMEGKGRLPDPDVIVTFVVKFLHNRQRLLGKKVLVTAGPTREAIDPVRFISNRSSGRMGYAIAKVAQQWGAEVFLVSGPTALAVPPGVHLTRVETAAEMREAVLKYFPEMDVVIKAAAVADYRVKEVKDQKIKKEAPGLVLELEKTPDILEELGRIKEKQVLVGFAAETQNLLSYAEEKLRRKNLDFIVVNDVSRKDTGFEVETNAIQIVHRNGKVTDYPLMPKEKVAEVILEEILPFLADKETQSRHRGE
ncbi:MAG TPA: bifunctional phosphopantothenoylcysteine decarboxylase/phosphopantothenate--cysteine ligase CoaBC [Candidatus Limnocylindrales bacterium]|nr:bifunctional phosphopantothenoylcysteine decarboxylase/phosphopantothenate--cysteine ligase CoaBC [Candidatus Limnocylindrales bacterium]